MVPTFVIGLREGLEAALIVGIIAAFLRQQRRTDLLRWVFAGVSIAVALCVAVGITLNVVSRDLPQRQQEGLETVIGILAVGMVTYMVVWMRRHSRELKGSLESAAATALESGASRAGRAMVLMAFLAVLREGFETVVFLLAAFNENGSSSAAGWGAALGIAVAVGVGYGIYRGGVRLNLSKFFRITGLVLVLVAGGLVVTAFHTAHEAGWLNAGQGSTFDLVWLVRPGSVQASLLTGMLGVQPHPVVIEVIGWLCYVIPIGAYVAWPPGRGLSRARAALATGLAGLTTAVAALVVLLTAPAAPASSGVTSGGGLTVQAVASDRDGVSLVSRSTIPANSGTFELTDASSTVRDGVTVATYAARVTRPYGQALKPRLSSAAIARLNGGRLPLGMAAGSGSSYPADYRALTALHVTLDPSTQRVIAAAVVTKLLVTVHSPVGTIPLSQPLHAARQALPAVSSAAALAAARADQHSAQQRSDRRVIAIALGLLAVLALGGTAGASIGLRRRPDQLDTPAQPLVGTQVSLT